jgi:hypothetical protein
MAWAKNGTPNTLTGASATIRVNDLVAKKFNQVLVNLLAATGTGIGAFGRVNNSSAANYAQRDSGNGGADETFINDTEWQFSQFGGTNGVSFHMMYMCNINGQEKLVLNWASESNAPGAGNAPTRRESASKFDTTTISAQITDIEWTDSSATIATSSNLSVLGSDLTPAAGVPFPTLSNVQAGSRAEITDTRKMYHFESGVWSEEGT